VVLRQGGGVDLFFNFGLLLVGGCWSYVVSTGDGLGVTGTIVIQRLNDNDNDNVMVKDQGW
jgi:hypothetical protein